MITIRLSRKSRTGTSWDSYLAMRQEVRDWCEANLVKDDYRITSNGSVVFDKEEDALAFRMKFDL